MKISLLRHVISEKKLRDSKKKKKKNSEISIFTQNI